MADGETGDRIYEKILLLIQKSRNENAALRTEAAALRTEVAALRTERKALRTERKALRTEIVSLRRSKPSSAADCSSTASSQPTNGRRSSQTVSSSLKRPFTESSPVSPISHHEATRSQKRRKTDEVRAPIVISSDDEQGSSAGNASTTTLHSGRALRPDDNGTASPRRHLGETEQGGRTSTGRPLAILGKYLDENGSEVVTSSLPATVLARVREAVESMDETHPGWDEHSGFETKCWRLALTGRLYEGRGGGIRGRLILTALPRSLRSNKLPEDDDFWIRAEGGIPRTAGHLWI
ncbi:hypothetical protein D0864_04269 [Hortaea werneckii]|uniref:Uncharacterized protein n=1 Tax=Hortaea werneckii TaxID=91943 RepID=A0A3M7GDB3_HORWE|nr:hypothetical protein D0864_04269 [Hortaea werneckii]